MTSGKSPLLLTVKSGDDITWRYVLSVDAGSRDIFAFKAKWFSDEQFAAAEEIHVDWKEEAGSGKIHHSRRKLAYLGQENATWLFRPDGEPVLLADDRVFTVDYRQKIYIQLIHDIKELPRYRQKAAYENMREERSINRRIRASAFSESAENRAVLHFMLELNNKLDDIMLMLRRPPEEEGAIAVRGTGISARSIIFHCGDNIPDETYGYARLTVGDGEDRFSFAAVLRIHSFQEAKTGCFYEGVYDNISEGIKDLIVRAVFANEREMIKDLQDL